MSHRLALFLLLCPALLLAITVPEKPLGPPDPERMHEALCEVLDGTRPLEAVRICVEQHQNNGFRVGRQPGRGLPGSRLILHGDGVALFAAYHFRPMRPDLVRQTRLSRDDLRRAIAILRDAGFCQCQTGSWYPQAHSSADHEGLPGNQIGVTIQGITVERYLPADWTADDPFARLRTELMRLTEHGQDLASVTNLADVMERIGKGTLDPRAIGFRSGWVAPDGLTTFAGQSTTRGYCVTCGRGGTTKTLRLERHEVAALVRVLHQNELHQFAAFRAPQKVGIGMCVLPAGTGSLYPTWLAGPECDVKHSSDPERFERVFSCLQALAERTLTEGQ
jgi:hypothetical protein